MRAVLLLVALLAAGAAAATTCHSFSVNATPAVGSAPLCPTATPCTFVADIAIDVVALTMSRFDGWFGPNAVRLSSQTSGTVTNSLACSTPGGTVLLLTAQTIYTGGSLTLSWVYSLASPSCAAPAAWYGLTPTSVTLGGVLPGGVALVGAAEATPALNVSAIVCPATTPLCLEADVALASGSGAPTITGCPLSGPCTFRLYASFVPATLALRWLDVEVGPAQASLFSATGGLAGADVQCAPGSNELSLGNVAPLVVAWTTALDCVTARANLAGIGATSNITTFVLNDPITLGSYAEYGGATGGSNSVADAAVACTATYTPTPTVSNSATQTASTTATRSPSNLPTQSGTPSPSGTRSPTRTPSGPASGTPTPSPTRTPSGTPSGTLTQTRTASTTPSGSVTPTRTPSISFTSTHTPTATSTQTPSNSQGPSTTATPALTPPATPSPTALSTDTPTQTPSASPTRSLSATSTASRSGTPSSSASPAASASSTGSRSLSLSASGTPTVSPTRSATRTPSPTASASPSLGFTPSPQPHDNDDDALSTAQIVGIVLGSVGAALLLTLVALAALAWFRPLAEPPRRPGAVEYVSVADMRL
jgi:hypothetical protein